MSKLKELRNEAQWDRVARVVLGLGLLSLLFFGPQSPWGLVGIIPLVTGLAGFCPLYRLVGVNTCSTNKKGPSSA